MKQVEAGRAKGLFVDYTAAARVTLSELAREYIEAVCKPTKRHDGHKGGDVEINRLEAMIADSRGEWAVELKRRADAVANLPQAERAVALSKMRRRTDPKRVPMHNVEFMQKTFAQVTAEDINDFIENLLDSVARATADRYVDVLSQVINWAIKKKGLKVAIHPVDGVTRPRYRNERDRRVGADEEQRLLSALVAEDSRRYARTCARYEAQESARASGRRCRATACPGDGSAVHRPC